MPDHTVDQTTAFFRMDIQKNSRIDPTPPCLLEQNAFSSGPGDPPPLGPHAQPLTIYTYVQFHLDIRSPKEGSARARPGLGGAVWLLALVWYDLVYRGKDGEVWA